MMTLQILKCADLAKTQKCRYLIKAILFFLQIKNFINYTSRVTLLQKIRNSFVVEVTFKERDGTTKSINLDWVHSWQYTETKLVNNVTEVNMQTLFTQKALYQKFCTDSPACSREGICTMFCLIASRKWQIHSAGIKPVLLQGNELERNVLVRPPKRSTDRKNVEMEPDLPNWIREFFSSRSITN